MNKKEAAIIAIFGFLAILQTSFVPHFKMSGPGWFEWVNFIDTAVAVIALFERRRHNLSWLVALWGGIFLDLYSGRFFGFWIFTLLALVVLVKFAVKKYVRIPSYW
jgi:hypothetical protein